MPSPAPAGRPTRGRPARRPQPPPRPVPGNSRGVAAGILAQWLNHGGFPENLLERVEADRAFVMEVVLGVLRWFSPLDWMLRRVGEGRPPQELRALAFVGLYQLLYMDAVQEYAAVNETVEAARPRLGERSVGWLNAVLRRAQRERDALRRDLATQPEWVRHSHPRPLMQRWSRQYGQLATRQLCAWNNARPEVCVRADPRRGDAAALLARLREAGVAAEPHPASGAHLRLPRGVRPEELPGYAEGAFVVQDPATALAVDLLAPRPGEAVLDACAAPGGKTLDLAARLNRAGLLVALDRHESRVATLRANLERSGDADWVRAEAADATALEGGRVGAWLGGRPGFNAVLVDAPCSSTGVIRRRPDVRWNFVHARLARLNLVQAALLDAAAGVLAPGGRIVYSTCSLEAEENEGLVREWLVRHPGFRVVRSDQRFPPRHGTDGAYAARLERSA